VRTKRASTPPKKSINAPVAAAAFQVPHPLAVPSVAETQRETADPLAIHEDLRPGNQTEHAEDLWLYLNGDVEVLSDSDSRAPAVVVRGARLPVQSRRLQKERSLLPRQTLA
jgi:hypothetical protein